MNLLLLYFFNYQKENNFRKSYFAHINPHDITFHWVFRPRFSFFAQNSYISYPRIDFHFIFFGFRMMHFFFFLIIKWYRLVNYVVENIIFTSFLLSSLIKLDFVGLQLDQSSEFSKTFSCHKYKPLHLAFWLKATTC